MKNKFLKLMVFTITFFSLGLSANAGDIKNAKMLVKEIKGALKNPYSIGFYAQKPTGLITHLALDGGGTFSGMGEPYDTAYGFGMFMEFPVNKKMRLLFDVNYIYLRKDLVKAGERGEGMWVFEQTNYATRYTQIFDTDVCYHQSVMALRTGLKYSAYKKLWIGLTAGLYKWQVNYANPDQSVTYGHDEGVNLGLTMMSGIDFQVGEDVTTSFFVDMNMRNMLAKAEIEDLFNPGWTWEDTSGAYVGGNYRIGMSISVKTK
jgi:hypothetical protein